MSYPANIDLIKVIKRLEVIKSLILLEEDEEIEVHALRLETYNNLIEINTILILLKQKIYSKASIAIENFINQHNKLSIYLDPEINALKLEIRNLEVEINSLSAEKVDAEKLIHEFNIRHNKELGDLLLKILQSRKEKAKNTPSEQEAEDDYNKYHKEYEVSKNENIVALTEQEKKELKDIYRKASKLCHPDIVSEEYKEAANKLFIELKAAYERNGLNRVKEIFENLKNGHFFINKSESLDEKELLRLEINKLHQRINELKTQIQTIKQTEIYTTIIKIDNWDDYFQDAKDRLKEKLNEIS